MIVIALTSTPGTIVNTIESKSDKLEDMVDLCKGEWEELTATAKEIKSPLAMAFAEVEVDGEYDDALSGELTFALDAVFAPVVEPVVVTTPPVTTTTPAKPRVATGGKKLNKAAQVRNLVTDNPAADATALMEMVAVSDIGIPKSKIKDYVIGSIKTVRG